VVAEGSDIPVVKESELKELACKVLGYWEVSDYSCRRGDDDCAIRYVAGKLGILVDELREWFSFRMIVIPIEQDGEIKFFRIVALNGDYWYDVIEDGEPGSRQEQAYYTILGLYGYTHPSEVKPLLKVVG